MTRNWLITCTWTLNPLSRAAELIGRFLKETFQLLRTKRSVCIEKNQPGTINCLGHLLLTTQTPEKILPIWPAPLDFCWLGAPAHFFESNLASSWASPVVTSKLDLDLHRCSDQNRYAFPLIARFEKLFFVDSSTSFSVFFLPNIFCVHVRKLGTSVRKSTTKTDLQNLPNQFRSEQTSLSFQKKIDTRASFLSSQTGVHVSIAISRTRSRCQHLNDSIA